MQKYAVIDIGSNSVRLMFVADGKVLYKTLNTTRLGEGIAYSGCLQSVAMERTAIAVHDFALRASMDGAEKVYAFATAAVRSAQNGRDFVALVKSRYGIDVEILSGEEEADIGVLGALGDKDGALIDVGGASTEIIVKQNGVCLYKKSVDVGVVRIKDICGRNKKRLEEFAVEKTALFGQVPFAPLTAIGGTATTMASLALGLDVYDSEKVTGTTLSQATVYALAGRLLTMPVEDIAAMPCMPKGRADVLAGGVLWMAILMNRLGFDSLTVSDRDNLEGYAVKKGLLL